MRVQLEEVSGLACACEGELVALIRIQYQSREHLVVTRDGVRMSSFFVQTAVDPALVLISFEVNARFFGVDNWREWLLFLPAEKMIRSRLE